jgi:hypothetical protein
VIGNIFFEGNILCHSSAASATVLFLLAFLTTNVKPPKPRMKGLPTTFRNSVSITQWVKPISELKKYLLILLMFICYPKQWTEKLTFG